MSDDQVIGWFIFLAGCMAGYVLGWCRGQISGIRWATERLDDPITPDELSR